MQQLDGTVIATALPRWRVSFHDTPINVSGRHQAYYHRRRLHPEQ